MNFMRILVMLPLICISSTPVQGSNRRNPSWLWRKRKLDEYAAPAILLRLSNPKTDKRKPFVILPNPPARSSPSPARTPSAPHEPNALLPSQRSPLPPPPPILMRPSPPPQRRPPSPPPPPPTRPPPPLPSKPRLPPKTAPPPPRLSSPLVPLSRPPSPQLMLTLAPLPRSASPPPRSPSPRPPSPTRRPPPPPPPRMSPPPPRSPSPRSPSPTRRPPPPPPRRPPPPPPRRPPPPTPPPPRPPSPVPPSPLPPHPHPPPPTRRPPPPQSPRIKPPPPLKPPPLLAPAAYLSSPPLANRGDVDSGTLPGSFCSDGQAMLEQINTYRALHNAPPLVWSSSLAAEAQAYAIQQSNIASEAFATTELCSADHSASGGESLYSSANAPPPDSSCKRAIASFYTEEKVYNYASPNLGDASAWHFVQMVWRGSTNVGCGVSVSDIVVRNYGLGGCKVVVCRFYPGFYLSSEAFQSNVLPPTDTSK